MRIKSICCVVLAMGISLQGLNGFAKTEKPGSMILKFREGINGLVVDTSDLKRILMNSGNVEKLRKGSYNVGLSLWNAPVFLIAGLNISPDPREVHLDWNASLKLVEGKYLMLPSVPGYEWVRNRLKNGLPFRLLFFYRGSGNLEVIRLELGGSIRRDLDIPMP